jgi:hypothetical protein
MSRVRIGRHLALAAMFGGIVMALFAPAAHAAEGERVLEPRMSLIGGCKEESIDPVEDPGCPTDQPPSPFSNPRAVATDVYGDIYVGSFGKATDGSDGRVDIFCPNGTFISELPVPAIASLAIDSDGNLYVYSVVAGQRRVLRFAPDALYNPESCEIEYGAAPPVLVTEQGGDWMGMAINRDNDHLFLNRGSGGITEYGSAEEGNPEIGATKGTGFGAGAAMTVDAARDQMYANAGPTEERIDIFDLNSVTSEGEYEVIGSIEPSSVPAGDFGLMVSAAVDEGTGNVFVLDAENCLLYEFAEDGAYLQTIAASFVQCTYGAQIAVDNGLTSPNGKLSEENHEGRFLYVPSNRTGAGHSYAFFVSIVGPPEVASIGAANVSENEVELRAQIDPNNLPTAYTFEYKVKGTEGWNPAGEGTLPTGNSGVEVSVPAIGLSPGTSYLFRVVATNEKGSDNAEGSFTTYPNVPTASEPCANALLRTGPSALLPDCRAYELVTPADTNGRAPRSVPITQGSFTSRHVSPVGDKVPFLAEGGSLPGFEAIGSEQGDPYVASRTDTGWSTTYTGPSPSDASVVVPNGVSPDQGYSFYLAAGVGPAVLAENTAYVRYPDGHSELLGQGSLGKTDPGGAFGRWISEGGGHIIFSTGGHATPPVQLEPDAAPDNTRAIYDRTPDGTTHVVSLKPGDVPFGAGEDANFQGASFNGAGVAFEVGSTLYLRYNNEETFVVGSGVEFAGLAEDGSRVFFVKGGNLKAFDIEAGIIYFTTSGKVTPVTVATDGTTAYFVSENAIAGSGLNPEGDSPQAGEQNLYRSAEGEIDFIATVTERDVEGSTTGRKADGLGLWLAALKPSNFPGALGLVPARSTPDGSVFLFKSRAVLTGYDPKGYAQVYRYAAGELQCLSCNPTGAAASSDATLQSEFSDSASEVLSPMVWPENLRADGRRAFFETGEGLVARDSDGLQDVYEWEEQGVGSCTRPEGCLYLISSSQSRRGEYLWAVSRSGDDLFFLSSDLLLGSDTDETPSIYDARVGGGFAEPVQGDCEGEGCRPSQQPPPPQPIILSPILGQGDNVKPRRCPKGKHKVKRGGKVRCVKKKHRRHSKQRAAGEKKGARR